MLSDTPICKGSAPLSIKFGSVPSRKARELPRRCAHWHCKQIPQAALQSSSQQLSQRLPVAARGTAATEPDRATRGTPKGLNQVTLSLAKDSLCLSERMRGISKGAFAFVFLVAGCVLAIPHTPIPEWMGLDGESWLQTLSTEGGGASPARGPALPAALGEDEEAAELGKEADEANQADKAWLGNNTGTAAGALRASQRAKDGEHPRNVLLVRVPKTGSTALLVTLERWAWHLGASFGEPLENTGMRTCHSSQEAVDAWHEVRHKNAEGVDFFASHMCFSSFMAAAGSKPWKSPDRPLVLSMLRHPWDRHISAWRYTRERCELGDDSLRSTAKCHQDFASYTERWCHMPSYCSRMFGFLRGPAAKQTAGGSKIHHVVKAMLNRFDFILILERFDESLAILHLLYGAPFRVLPYFVVNKDSTIPMPRFQASLRRMAIHRGLQLDMFAYAYANKTLSEKIASVDPQKFARVVDLIRKANGEAHTQCAYSDTETRQWQHVSESLVDEDGDDVSCFLPMRGASGLFAPRAHVTTQPKI